MAAPDTAGPLRVICGPTAAGKTAIAMQLAERFPLTIISADSRQIYRQFDVGTGKPTRDEQARVPHSGIDVVDPTTRYSAAAFAADANGWLTDAIASERTPVIVGGTGFYIRSLVQPLFAEPELDQTRRQALARWLAELSTDELRRWCRALDPRRADLGRTQLLRAVEIALLTGHKLTALHERASRTPSRTARYLLVDAGKALHARIEQRIGAMFRAGWMSEVELLMRSVSPDAPAWLATGYAAVRRAVLGELTEREARDAVLIATRQYAKRQRTWFRHQLADDDVTTVDSTEPDALARATNWWASES